MKLYLVDVFAEEKYQGNQLAVLIPDRETPISEMQQIAREINFSETTFITSGKQGNGGYDVKIFTPDTEVPFAGHPTLGTAYIIHKEIEKGATDKVLLNLQVGTIPVDVKGDTLIMAQNQPNFEMTVKDKGRIAEILKINGDDISDEYPIQIVSTGLSCLIAQVKTLEALGNCRIDHEKFSRFHEEVCKTNLLVFAREDDDVLRVRVFMDDTGFLEDPATGSANGNLAAYLLKHNFFGKSVIKYSAKQGYEMGRPSLISVNASLTDGKYQLMVGGKVQPVAEGKWY